MLKAFFVFNQQAEAAQFLKVTPLNQSEDGQKRFASTMGSMASGARHLLCGGALLFIAMAGYDVWNGQYAKGGATAAFAAVAFARGHKRGKQADFYNGVAKSIEEKGVARTRQDLQQIVAAFPRQVNP